MARRSFFRDLLGAVARAVSTTAPSRRTTSRPDTRRQGARPASGRTGAPAPAGQVATEYRPHLDGEADPGEIVWTWVPYEDDPTRGKDRPVLVVGRDGRAALGLMLTSKDKDGDGGRGPLGDVTTDRHGNVWIDIGSGPWDAQGRPSEVRLDRVLRIDPAGIRREGAVLDRATFDLVTRALAQL